MLSSDCVIIGSGVAGMTAAIYLKRANVDFILLEKHAPGGQVNMTNSIENYPGFKNIDGVTLAMSIFDQVQELDVNYRYGNVVDIVEDGEYKIIKTDVEEIRCKKIIIATGRKAKSLGLDNERQLVGRGVSWCAVCDGALYKGKPVAVVGGGNSALEEALYLSNICKEVYIIHRRDEFRADKCVQESIKTKNNIKVLYNSVIKTLKEKDNRLDGLSIETNGQEKDLNVDGLFIFIGYEPENNYLANIKIECDKQGNIIVDKNMRTNIAGIYACGDIISKEVYQIITAEAEGALAATSVQKDLQNIY